MNKPARIAVFVSGGGTNLQALLDHFNGNQSDVARIVLVIASRGGVKAISRAQIAGVPTVVHGPTGDDLGDELLDHLEKQEIDLVVLAGYLKLIPLSVIDRFQDRILNIHPALLPAFGGAGMYGQRVHQAVIDSGATVSGATVHLVGERYDEGPIVAQWPVPVLPGDDSEQLASRVLEVEHVLLRTAIEAFLGESEAARQKVESGFVLKPDAIPSSHDIQSLIEIKKRNAESVT